MQSQRCPQAHRLSDICETKKNWCQAFADPARDKMAQPTQTKHHSSRFGNVETSDRLALHFRRPSSLREGLGSNISMKASPRTMLEDGTLYYARRHLVLCWKAAPCTMLGVISYHRVLVDGGLAKGTGRCRPCKKSTGRCRLCKGYW